jgi:hypothetical protein
MTLQSLIDKYDNFEIIRDTVAQIIADEVVNQRNLAVAASKDPTLWDFKVFTEHTNPWEQFAGATDLTPILNISYDNSTFDGNVGNVVEYQKATAVFNLDAYGVAHSIDDPSGHIPGDQAAVLNAQRVMRLVRNIVMAGENTYLNLRGLVWKRWVDTTTVFQPIQNEQTLPHIVAARTTLRVDFNEFSPQYEPEILEQIAIELKRSETGEVLANLEYTYV